MKKLVLIFGAVAMFTLGSYTNSVVWELDKEQIDLNMNVGSKGFVVDSLKGYVVFKKEYEEDFTCYLKINLDSIDFKCEYDFFNGDLYINN